MLNFKPSNPPGDSSEDLEDMVGNSEESEESDVSDDIDAAEEITDVGEESGEPNNQENPFFTGNDDREVSDEEEDDDLIKALKAAREKKKRNSPPDIKTSELITDLSFHLEADIIAIANISGDLSVFNYTNEENKIERKLKLPKKTLRGLEFDKSGASLLTFSKDKTLRILDTETWTVK